jgi:hypothetical protein
MSKEGLKESISVGSGTIALHLGFSKDSRAPFVCPIVFDDDPKANLTGNIEILSK